MKAIRYFTMAATLVATMGCQDEELLQRSYLTDPNAVRIIATVGDTPTRSNPAGDASTVTQFNPGDKIAVSAENQGTVIYDFEGGTSWAPVDESKYLIWNSSPQRFMAYYPETYQGSGNVPTDQHTTDLIATADYMKFDSEMEKQETVSFTMARQTARVVIHSTFKWGSEYKDAANAPTYKVDAIQVNCIGVSDIKPYQPDHYYALVNSGSADPNATFLTITISPLDGQGTSVTHTVKGIPVFQAGYSYTYNLTIGKNGVTISDVTVEDWSTGSIIKGEGSADDDVKTYFEVNAPNGNFTFVGGSKNYEVNSYIRKGDGTLVAVPWTAKFVRKLDESTYEEIEKPDWITSFTSKGIGSNTNDVCTVTVKAATTTNNHYYALKNNTPVSGTFNLSNATGGEAVENTANCYIINASGSYSFPLVYGNAIKNGTTNESAYKSSVTGTNVLENLVNHNNTPITSPYIAAHEGCTPDNAILVWQDAENLVSNIELTGSSATDYRIAFDVEQWSIKQGNAIIAVRDANNTILWSWHIWVTDYKPLQAASVMNSYDPTATQQDKKIWTPDNKNSYTLMGLPLGWCDAETASGNEVIIQFTQTETGNTQVVTIKQEPLSIGNNAPFYQWGRKDPILPSKGLASSKDNDKTYYGNYRFVLNGNRGNRGVSIGTAIQNPHIMYSYSNDTQFVDWCNPSETAGEEKDYFLLNLWDTHDNTNDENKLTLATKTIYDPSPVGYVIPPSGALNGITYNGKNVMLESSADYDGVNSLLKSEDEVKNMGGWLFYCKGMNGNVGSYDTSGGVMFFPATGRREDNGNLKIVGEAGTNWTTGTYRASAAHADAFNLSSNLKALIPENGLNKFYAVTVRPIREQ